MKTILSIIILLTFHYSSTGCSCNSHGELDYEKYFNYDFIFKGQITKIDTSSESEDLVTIQVHKIFKGEKIEDMEIILSKITSCYEPMLLDSTMLIFGNFRDGKVFHNYCSRSHQFWEMDEIHSQIEKAKNELAPDYQLKYLFELKQELDFLNNPTSNGKATATFENGSPCSEGIIQNNLPVGLWVNYYPNGKLKSKGEYNVKGVKIGHWEEFKQYFSEDLSYYRLEEGDYLDGERNGHWKYKMIKIEGEAVTSEMRNETKDTALILYENGQRKKR